ncbi:MAG: hypothetical protein WCF03_18135 [Nitrososphaeraceae archaeon]
MVAATLVIRVVVAVVMVVDHVAAVVRDNPPLYALLIGYLKFTSCSFNVIW